jgi:hypothetical protein
MTGKVIKQVVIPHSCSPGWRWKPIPEDSDIPSLVPGGKGGLYGVPPTPWESPKGTAWRCDCGVVWVSLGAPDPYSPGFCEWRRERWLERWRRERREAR